MPTIPGPHMTIVDDPSQLPAIPYVVSLTKNLRLLVALGGQPAKEKMESLGKSLATRFENDHIINEAVRYDPRAGPNVKAIRQVDIKENENIVLKTFVSWNKELNCWHIFVELPEETVWEDGGTNI
jgi:hypothetical protein